MTSLSTPSSGSSSLRVVIAEDDFLVAEMVESLLLDLGHQVVGRATNGLDAVALTEAGHPDAVVLDIRMPKVDGLEAARRIHQRCPTPIVVLTAYQSPDLATEASAAGVGAFLVKPPVAVELDRALTIATARFRDIAALTKANQEMERRTLELEVALANIKTLRGLLPICSYCKKVRDDDGYWQLVDAYLAEHTEAEVSHGICPGCLLSHFPGFDV